MCGCQIEMYGIGVREEDTPLPMTSETDYGDVSPIKNCHITITSVLDMCIDSHMQI